MAPPSHYIPAPLPWSQLPGPPRTQVCSLDLVLGPHSHCPSLGVLTPHLTMPCWHPLTL